MLTFLFIHGTFGHSDDWFESQIALQKLGPYTCQSIVLPAHDGRPLENDRSVFEQMIRQLRATVQQPTVLIGYSLGGRVALHLTKLLQAQGVGLIRALILEGAHPGLEDPAQRKQRAALDDQRAQLLREQGLPTFLDHWYQQPLFGPIAQLPEERAQLVERRAKGNDANPLARTLEECSPGRVPPLWDALPTLRPPILFVHGEHDAAYRDVAEQICARRPATKRAVVAGAGHNTHLASPERFAQVIHDFVQTTPELAPHVTSSHDARAMTSETKVNDTSRSREEMRASLPDAPILVARSSTPTLRPHLEPGRVVAWQQSPLVALHKPSGVLVHNSAYAGPPEETLLDMAEAELQQRVFPLHRIDRGTSGLVLAVDQQGLTTSWMPALRDERSMREYVAIVRGHLRESIRVERDIPNDQGERLSAQSMIAPLACSPTERLSLVRVRIVTGRRHQIRRHCRSINHPLIGDSTWGNSKLNRELRERRGIDRLALHAWRVQFVGPDGQHYDIACAPDAAFQSICRDLFGFEGWEELAATEPLSEEMDRVHGPDPTEV